MQQTCCSVRPLLRLPEDATEWVPGLNWLRLSKLMRRELESWLAECWGP